MCRIYRLFGEMAVEIFVVLTSPFMSPDISVDIFYIPVCSQAINVEPLPPNNSKIFSPDMDDNWIARTASSAGFCVG